MNHNTMRYFKQFALLISLQQFLLSSLAHGLIQDSIDRSDTILKRSFHQIIVAEAIELSPQPYNNANPPQGIFRIHEVLRGYIRSNQNVNIYWNSPKPLKVFEPWTSDMPEEWRVQFYHRPLREGWKNELRIGPQKGEKLIIFCVQQPSLSQGLPLLRAVKTFRYSEPNRKVTLRNMALADRHPRIQGYILTILLLICPIPFCLFVSAVKTKERQKNKRF